MLGAQQQDFLLPVVKDAEKRGEPGGFWAGKRSDAQRRSGLEPTAKVLGSGDLVGGGGRRVEVALKHDATVGSRWPRSGVHIAK